MSKNKPKPGIRMWWTHSSTFYRVATEAWACGKDTPRDASHPQTPITAMVFAFMSLEAFANELILAVEKDRARCRAAQAFLDLTQASVTGRGPQTGLKLNLAKIACTGLPFETGARPFQAFALLRVFRNALVHYTPHVSSLRLGKDGHHLEHANKVVNLIGHMRGERIHRKDALDKTSWMFAFKSPDAERWACETALGMVEAVMKDMPGGQWRRWTEGTVREFRDYAATLQ